MAKKKFLNLDNMNILWDSIDRNFLRKEDIPYVEFEALLTENNTIIGAINELYNMLISGGGGTIIPPSIDCNISSLQFDYLESSSPKEVSVVYKNCLGVYPPEISYSAGSTGWLNVVIPSNFTGDATAKTYKYGLKVGQNTSGQNRTATVTFSGGKGSEKATHQIIITQTAPKSAEIVLPSPLTINAVGGNKSITVKYNDAANIFDPEIVEGSTWLSISGANSANSTYTITVNENAGTINTRSGSIKFKCVGLDGKEVSKTLAISQSAYPNPDIDASLIPEESDYTGLNNIYQVTYSDTATINTPSTNDDWIQITKTTEAAGVVSYRIIINKNTTTSERIGIITFSCVGKNGQSKSINKSIRQLAANGASITANNITIDWNATTAKVSATYKNYKEILAAVEKLDFVDGIRETSRDDSGKINYELFGIAPNKSDYQRSGDVVFSCIDNLDQPYTKTIQLIQNTAPIASISVTPTAPEVEYTGGNVKFAVSYSNAVNYTARVSKVNDTTTDTCDWITMPGGSYDSNEFTVVVSPNNGDTDRKVTIVFECLGYNDKVTPTKVVITQKANGAPDIPDIPDEPTQRMYYGHTPADMIAKYNLTAANPNGFFTNITEDCIKECVEKGYMIETDAKTMGKTSFGIVPKNSLIVIAVPSSSNLIVKQDNGFGAQIDFTVTPTSNGEQKTTVNGISYDLYGQLAGITYNNNGYFYVNNK